MHFRISGRTFCAHGHNDLTRHTKFHHRRRPTTGNDHRVALRPGHGTGLHAVVSTYFSAFNWYPPTYASNYFNFDVWFFFFRSGLTAIMKKLNIGDTSDHAHHHEHDFHAARQRRYITREEYPPAAFNRTCFSLDVLRVAYDFVGKDVLNQHEFERKRFKARVVFRGAVGCWTLRGGGRD